MKDQKLLLGLPVMLLLVSSVVCSNPSDPPYIDVPNDEDGAATVLIWAIGNGVVDPKNWTSA